MGITLGSHGMTHGNLDELPREEARREIQLSRKCIERQSGLKIRIFAYPRGRFNTTIRDFVRKAGFSMACGIEPGCVKKGDDLFSLKRINISDNTSGNEFKFYLSGALDWYYGNRMGRR